MLLRMVMLITKTHSKRFIPLRKEGIPISVISEGMGHDSETTTQIYLATLETNIIDKANKKILKLL